MEQIIKRIIEIEDKAQSIVDSISEVEAELDKKTQTEILALQNNIKEKTDIKIQQLATKEREYSEKRLKELHEKIDEQTGIIDSVFQQNSEKWVDIIYENIINS